MTKVLPSDDSAMFLIAEDMRQEMDGKYSILGLIPGNKLNMKLPAAPNWQVPGLIHKPAIPSLSFMWIFPDGEGDFDASAEFIDPAGNVLFTSPNQQITKTANQAMNFVVKVSPFICDTGIFKFVVTLDGKKYHRTVTVQ